MNAAFSTVPIDSDVKKRLEILAESTGRSPAVLVTEAINNYLDVNEWQVAGINRAIASLDRGEGVSHQQVKDWVTSWGSPQARPIAKRP
jgi:RHH-type rel operon transcriptional repressor/antitoxin RelB